MITVPTDATPEAPFFLSSEWKDGQPGGWSRVAISDSRIGGRIGGSMIARVYAPTLDLARERAWLLCCALNAAEAASRMDGSGGSFVVRGEDTDSVEVEVFGEVAGSEDWATGTQSSALTRESAGHLAGMLAHFAATGKLP